MTAPSPAPPAPAPPPWLSPGPLPPRGLAQLAWGLAQPLLGLRVIVGDPALLRAAAWPVLLFAGFCVLVAMGAEDDASARLEVFLDTLVTLAPAPVILFGKSYRRLAAAARVPLGLSPRTADMPGLRSAIGDAIRQAILLGIGLVPVWLAFELAQELWPAGADAFVWVAWALGGFWALHWIVVEALDNGHTVDPAAPAKQPDQYADPWFVQIYQLPLLRRFSGLLRRLSRPWRRELQLVARHPELALGFGLGVAAIIAVPFAALVFRPAAVVAAVHVLGRVDEAAGAAAVSATVVTAPATP
ncbi:hypothetical protein [Nannocystis radixulma]|uniref:Uncharacterized protein n=1 Tax=Nannocystis radixulma TaxID=2995305 RepID=A0ABT5BCR2_9BACT|nr:hypothetical protein [Nannocystis radixulma]MDC0670852.1 hypothetical protein [Nannocystis radixulma]